MRFFFYFALVFFAVTALGVDVKVVEEKHSLINHRVVLEFDAVNDVAEVLKAYDFNVGSDVAVTSISVFELGVVEKVKSVVVGCALENQRVDENGNMVVECLEEIRETRVDQKEVKTRDLVDVVEDKGKRKSAKLKPVVRKGEKKRVVVEWKTMVGKSNKGWGSSGNWGINPAGWWDYAWGKRIKINVSSPSAVDNYDVLVKFDGNESYFSDLNKFSCNDFRFADSMNANELSYYTFICDNQDIVVWFDANLTAGDNIFYLYFDNPSAVSASDFNSVFILVDNFEDGDVTNNPTWNCPTEVIVVDGKMYNNGYGANSCGVVLSTIGSGETLLKDNSFLFAFRGYNTFQQGMHLTNNFIEDTIDSYQAQNLICRTASACQTEVTLFNNPSSYSGQLQILNIDNNGFASVMIDGSIIVREVKLDLKPTSYIKNIQVGKNGGLGYLADDIFISKSYLDVNVSHGGPSSSSVSLNDGVFYNDYFVSNGNLDYTATYMCDVGAVGRLDVNSGGELLKSHTLTCDGTLHNLISDYGKDEEMVKDINFFIVVNDVVEDVFPYRVYFDYNSPVITAYDANVVSGFNITSFNASAKMQCTDTASNLFDFNNLYVISIFDVNQVVAYNQDNNIFYSNNGLQLNENGNVIKFECFDAVGKKATQLLELDAYKKRFYFVWNDTGQDIAVTDYTTADINSVMVYSYDLNTYYDMKANNKTSIDYVGTGEDALYFQVKYTSASFLTIRTEFDLSVVEDTNVPICFWKYQPVYEQAFVSSQIKPLIFKNANTQCYLAGSKTKFANGDSFLLSVYAIPSSYYLYTTNENDELTRLSIVAGEQSNNINLDILLLKLNTYSLDVSTHFLTGLFVCGGSQDCNYLKIYYNNPNADNNALTIKIIRDNDVVFSQDMADANVNEAILLVNISNFDINGAFEVWAVIRNENGDIEYVKWYGNTNLSKSQFFLNPFVAFVFGILVFLVGFTLVSTKYALGWFGALMALAGIGIMSFGGSEWFIFFGQGVLFIVGVYIMLIYKDETARVV